MTALENAKKFFEACDTPAGWEGCKNYVADGSAPFVAQCEPLTEIHTIQTYCDWMVDFCKITPDARYDLHSTSYDESTQTAVFFATFHAKHTGAGGPVPATHKETHTHYVYVLKMNDDQKVEKMTKIWNAPWAMKELGWV